MNSEGQKPEYSPEELEKIISDNQNLSLQVNRLLRTEYDLYNTQLELDTQLSLYRELYETGKRISSLKDFNGVFLEMEHFIIDSLNFGGFLLLERMSNSFEVMQSGGFCTNYINNNSVERSLLITDKQQQLIQNVDGFFITQSMVTEDQLKALKALCPFETFVAHFLCLGNERKPRYLLIIGNPVQQDFFTEINPDSGHMVSLGNLISLVETVLDNQLYYQQLKEEREQLEIKVNKRTEELNKAMNELKVLNDKLEADSFHDALTGLYNRRGFFVFGEKFLNMAKRQGKHILLLFCDLDKFKPINDKYGHKEGDLALQATAGILKKACRNYDIISRFGGDEFVILFDDFNEEDFKLFLERFDKLFDEYNESSCKNYDILISYGYTICSPAEEDDVSFDKLFEKADKNLYNEKHRKRKRKGKKS